MIFLHMGCYLGGVQRESWLVLLVIKTLIQLGYKIVVSRIIWVIDDFCLLIILRGGKKMYLG